VGVIICYTSHTTALLVTLLLQFNSINNTPTRHYVYREYTEVNLHGGIPYFTSFENYKSRDIFLSCHKFLGVEQTGSEDVVNI
jgi:bacteriorhodopsin